MSDQQTKQDISPTIPAKNIVKEIAFGFVDSEGKEQIKQFEMGADAKYVYLERTEGSKESCNSLQNKIDVYNKVFNENELTTLGLAEGANSMAEGNCSYAKGNYSHAEGSNTQAIGNSSHAEGVGTVATGAGSHTEGHNTEASSQDAHAEGYTSIASGYASHAEGMYFGTLDADDMQRTVASGAGSHAEGVGTQAKEGGSHSEGVKTVAGGEASHAEGSNTQSLAKYSHTEGVLTTVNTSATGGHAEGRETIAGDEAAHAEGYGAQALGYISHAEGWNTIAEAQGSHTEGLRTIAKGKYQHVQGKYNEEDTVDTSGYGKYSHIVGGGSSAERKNIHTLDWDGNAWYQGDVQAKKNLKADEDAEIGRNLSVTSDAFIGDNLMVTENTTTQTLNVGLNAIIGNSISLGRKADSVIGGSSIAEGVEVIASNIGSHAEGYKTEATGKYAHAEGFSDESTLGLCATGNYSHAEGWSSRATKAAAHSEGKQTLAAGVGAHAEGDGSYAQADCAHAEGWGTEANEKGSHAEGNQSRATGKYAHAEGGATTINGNTIRTEAQGEASHAEGIATQAFKIGSHTEGFYTKANKDYQHVQGKWNVEDNTKVHIVGWGDETQRKNIHTLDEQGNAWFAGDVQAKNGVISNNLTVSKAIAAENAVFSNKVEAKGLKIEGNAEIQTVNGYKIGEASSDNHGLVKLGYELNEFNFPVEKNSEGKIFVNVPYGQPVTENNPGLMTAEQLKSLKGLGDAMETKAPISHPKFSGSISMSRKEGSIIGQYSSAIGYSVTASGSCAHAEGYKTTASGSSAHAEGEETIASGLHTHAEGWKTVASGQSSHAEGQYSIAQERYAHAEGYETLASGAMSHAEGDRTIAAAKSQHVQGKFNTPFYSSSMLHVVGNGYNNTSRSNAHTLDYEGNAFFAGAIILKDVSSNDKYGLRIKNGALEIIPGPRNCQWNLTDAAKNNSLKGNPGDQISVSDVVKSIDVILIDGTKKTFIPGSDRLYCSKLLDDNLQVTFYFEYWGDVYTYTYTYQEKGALTDFDTQEINGRTYITSWRGTEGGVSSSRLIVPITDYPINNKEG